MVVSSFQVPTISKAVTDMAEALRGEYGSFGKFCGVVESRRNNEEYMLIETPSVMVLSEAYGKKPVAEWLMGQMIKLIELGCAGENDIDQVHYVARELASEIYYCQKNMKIGEVMTFVREFGRYGNLYGKPNYHNAVSGLYEFIKQNAQRKAQILRKREMESNNNADLAIECDYAKSAEEHMKKWQASGR